MKDATKPTPATGIDTQQMVAYFEALRSSRSDPRQLAMLDVHLEHMTAEVVDYDIDRLMATMVEQPIFRFYGVADMAPVDGYEAVRDFYLKVFEAPKNSAGMDVERVVVGDDAVAIECHLLLAKALVTSAFPQIAEMLDPDRNSFLRKRACIVIPFVGGKIAGEYHYFDGPYTLADVVYLD